MGLMSLTALNVLESRRKLKTTVLYREGGVWHDSEIDRLTMVLQTPVSYHPEHPEIVVLFGHYGKEQALKAIGFGVAFTTTQVVGLDNLPFDPGFTR